MDYKKLLELYKAGKLDEEQKAEVEQDIEKQIAISDYLFDVETLLADNENAEASLDSDAENISEKKTPSNEAAFIKYVNKSIRKAFMKTGAIVGVVVLILVLGFIFVIPKIQDKIYYNPNEKPVRKATGTKRIDLDMGAFTELYCPGMYRDDVQVIANGGGSYNISIRQFTSFSGQLYDFCGVINKGNLLLYNDNFYKYFGLYAWNVKSEVVSFDSDFYFISEVGYRSKTQAFEDLDELDPTKKYVAYVTLNKVMNYTDFTEWNNRNNARVIWCKLCFVDSDKKYYVDNLSNYGFVTFSSSFLDFDAEKYPYLTCLSTMPDGAATEEKMTTHVMSVMNYLADQDKFLKMMGFDGEQNRLRYYAKNIGKNGLNIFGFVMIGTKEDICALRDIPEVDYITTKLVQYE